MSSKTASLFYNISEARGLATSYGSYPRSAQIDTETSQWRKMMAAVQKVARDKNGQIMWVRRYPKLSPLTYREWFEGKDMQSGWITTKEGQVFDAPFTLSMEEINSGRIR